MSINGGKEKLSIVLFSRNMKTMLTMTIGFIIVLIMSSLIFVTPIYADATAATRPRQIVLTWQRDPQTSMTITWRTDVYLESPKILYSDNPDADMEEYEVTFGSSTTFTESSAWINSVELTGLSPGTDYYVIIPHAMNEERFKFRTIPEDPEEIVFLAGSDFHVKGYNTSGRNIRRELHLAAVLEDPDFVIAAGDLWYHDDDPINDVEQSVDQFFDDWHELMITNDGRRIPIVPTEGNHDGKVYYFNIPDKTQPKNNAPFYYNRFYLPGNERYYSLQFGPDLTIICLNSEHSGGLGPEQTNWLNNTLQQYQDSKWLIPVHHIGPYPAYRSFASTQEAWIRNNWVPLYEEYGVKMVISGHDHVYKRTHPIKNNQIDEENGIVYIGDGGWAAQRDPDPAGRWYISEAASAYNFFKVSVLKMAGGKSSLYVEPILPLSTYEGTPFIVLSDGVTDEDVVDIAIKRLTFDKLTDQPIDAVTKNLNLPARGFGNVQIQWHSSHPDTIGTDGKVYRPIFKEDTIVVLTATITYGEISRIKEFHIPFRSSYIFNGISVNIDYGNKNVRVIGDYEFEGGNKISALLTDKIGKIIYVDQTIRDSEDFFEFDFEIDGDNCNDEYILKVGAADRESAFKTEFYLTTQATDITIKDVILSTEIGGPPSDILIPSLNMYVNVDMFNNTGVSINTSVIAALYDSDGILVNLQFQYETVEGKKSGSTNINLKMPDNVEGHYIKIFVWDNINSLKPLAKKVMF